MPERSSTGPTPINTANCTYCQLRPLCLPDHLGDAAAATVADIVKGLPPRPKGSVLYRQGEPRKSYFALRSGSAKALVLEEDGNEQVVDFHYPGDLVGISSLEQNTYVDTVVLLERSGLCEISVDDLERHADREGILQDAFLHKIAAEFADLRHARMRMTHLGAAERVADFLLDLRSRMTDLRRVDDELHLPMSRHEIGSYLGLASETISRTLTRFEDAGLIGIQGRHITISDVPGLQEQARQAHSIRKARVNGS